MVIVWFACFFAEQMAAALLFKWGADRPALFWSCFLAGNAFGATSIYFVMKIYTVMQVNLAGAIAGGGTFIIVQLALVRVFRQRLSPLQYAGLAAVALGIAMVSLGKLPEPAAQPAVVAPPAGAPPSAALAR